MMTSARARYPNFADSSTFWDLSIWSLESTSEGRHSIKKEGTPATFRLNTTKLHAT